MRVAQRIDEIGVSDPLALYSSLQSSYTYLLESVEGNVKVARYSILGFDPVFRVGIKEGKISIRTKLKIAFKKSRTSNPIKTLREIFKEFEYPCKTPDTGIRFAGGLVGYISYDIVRYFVPLPDLPDSRGIKDCEFIITRYNIVFDHLKGRAYLISNIFGDEKYTPLDKKKILAKPEASPEKPASSTSRIVPNMKKEAYERSVRISKEYIREGDIFQVVHSQILSADFKGDELYIYKKMKEINPSPYMYFLDFGDIKVAGSSPEMLIRVEGRDVRTRPIAGTHPRGKTKKEDILLEKEMLGDEKERAEHVMLVDLGRNDIGKVSDYGSVKVTDFMIAEKYSHVQHIVSEVEGRLMHDKDMFDALEAVFPAGTVSGAPKVRAMEIINELEPERRGIYAGAVGYFSFNQNMDTAIAIRTLLFKDGKVYAQAGAGIVADSVPEKEYAESMNKARALLDALGLK